MRIPFFVYSICVFLLSGCLGKHTEYSIACAPAISEDGKYINCIVAESDGTITMENGGYNKTAYTTTYWLKQYETATGKLTNRKKLVRPSAADNVNINCFGCFNNKIWLYVNGIKAYDMKSLEEVTNEEKIAAANGMKKTVFPADERLLYANVEKGHIDFMADNQEPFRLTLKDFIIHKKTGKLDTDLAKKQVNSLSHHDDYGVRCDTFNNKVFAFAKNEAAAKKLLPGHSDISETAYRMTLFKADYSTHQLGMHNSFTYYNMQQAEINTYLNPCFAADTYNGSVIHLLSPDGYIVIHQDVPGEKSKALITRLDLNGKELWKIKTGVSTKIESCSMEGRYLCLSTNRDYMLSPFIGKDALCIIDIYTGNIIQPSLKD